MGISLRAHIGPYDGRKDEAYQAAHSPPRLGCTRLANGAQAYPAWQRARGEATSATTANIGSGSPPASACRGNLPPCFHTRPEPVRGGLRRDRFRCPAPQCPGGTAIAAQRPHCRLCAARSSGAQIHDGSASQLGCTSTLVGLCRRRPGSHTTPLWDGQSRSKEVQPHDL